MSKRARYVGPHEEVNVSWPPGAVVPEKSWTVQVNSFLPDDAPAALRDEIGKGEDWRLEDHPEMAPQGRTAKKDDA
jgi:hypothetical protein